MMPPLWEPQVRSIAAVHAAMIDGKRRICLTLPTGAGKGRIACELIRDWVVAGYKVGLYTNRRMLIEQLSGVLQAFGLDHGVRAANWQEDRDFPVQISSVQTEHSRVSKKRTWELHDADRVIFDEAHLQANPIALALANGHLAKEGSAYLGMTATPLGLAHMYDDLILGGTNSEMRQCGALVACSHYGPDEPDCSKVKKSPWEYTENDVRKVMVVQNVVGSIMENFDRLNPFRKPTILFAPGVDESLWLAQRFSYRRISAAHIDGDNCWINGKTYSSNKTIRKEIVDGSRSGEIKVVCNRFVLREGIDMPWLAHGILATVFGSLGSYIQSGGRLLRSHPSLQAVCIQDHGGNWHRHGSLNQDRTWRLDLTESMMQGLRIERLRDNNMPDREPGVEPGPEEKEPARCPQCAKILLSSKCSCGFVITRKTRPVIDVDGRITNHEGDIYRPKKTKMMSDSEKKWISCYYRGRNSSMTFLQCEALFYREQGYYPPRTLPLMPVDAIGWRQKVKDVPANRLQSKGETVGQAK